MRAMIPWSPQREARPASSLSLVDRVFGDFWRGEAWPQLFEAPLRGFSPQLDVQENDTAYVVSAELPGLSLEDVKLSIKEGQLSISGEKKAHSEEERDGIRYNERSYGRFERVISLRDKVREEDIEAVFKDGVLKVTLPKRDPNEGVRSIDVKSA